MLIYTRLLAAAFAALSGASAALAAPFNSFDPRSMAMGGAGVAAADTVTATLFNPALLVPARDNDFTTALPVMGSRAFNPDGLPERVAEIQDAGLVDQLGREIAALDYAAVAATATRLGNDPEAGLAAIDNDRIEGEVGVATVIGIPHPEYGAAVVANSWSVFGGVGRYLDQARLADLAAAAAVCDGDPSHSVAECAAVAGFDPADLASSVEVRGLRLREFGLAVSHPVLLWGAPFSLGVTGKYVQATAFDYAADVNEANQADMQDQAYILEHANFNLDVGLAKALAGGWHAGLVVKNVIPQEYRLRRLDTATATWLHTGAIRLGPQARAGIAYRNGRSTTALDLDLTTNSAVGHGEESRHLAVGSEWQAMERMLLRVGYRADLVNGGRGVYSAGVGVSPFGMQVDLALAGNADEIAAAFQLAVRF